LKPVAQSGNDPDLHRVLQKPTGVAKQKSQITKRCKIEQFIIRILLSFSQGSGKKFRLWMRHHTVMRIRRILRQTSCSLVQSWPAYNAEGARNALDQDDQQGQRIVRQISARECGPGSQGRGQMAGVGAQKKRPQALLVRNAALR